MDKLFEFFNNHEVYYYIVLGSLFLLAILSTIIIALDHKRARKAKEQVIEKALDPIEEKEKQMAKLELEKVISRLNENVEKRDPVSISDFEQEQEDKAIISYQELLNFVKGTSTISSEKEPVSRIDNKVVSEADEITSSEYVQTSLDLIDEPLNEETVFNGTNFKTTEFISPIFGKMDNSVTYPKIAEFRKKDNNEEDYPRISKTAIQNEISLVDTKGYDEEVTKNTEFLNALKEFRQNL